MTRFARAKGSKASNLKSPEDSTPWEVMKEQLLMSKKNNEDNKNREEAEKQRIENYDKFLKEHRTQKRKATWCDFPEAEIDKNVNLLKEQKDQNKIKRKKLSIKQNIESVPIGDSLQNVVYNEDIEKNVNKSKKNKVSAKFNNREVNGELQEDQNMSNKKKNKKRITELEITSVIPEIKAPTKQEEGCKVKISIIDGSTQKTKKKIRNPSNVSDKTVNDESNDHINETDKNNTDESTAKKKKKRKNKNKNNVSEATVNVESNNHASDTKKNVIDGSIEKKKKKGKNKKKLSETTVNVETKDQINDTDKNIINSSTEKKKKKRKNKKNVSKTTVNTESNGQTNDTDKNIINKSVDKKNALDKTVNIETNDTDKTQPSPTNKKVKNNKDRKKARRKPINDRSFELIINGKEVQLIRFDGFPIMKRDADRLEELKKNMISKGIPKSEVKRTMKLERRRAEKALARLKRDVCYNCRKGGHNLSDCPDLKSRVPGLDSTEGICFKCGSTEHRQFECKVQKDKEFRFATCFICKESGHIARQCPDNPKGLYPNGGCCKLCGDVTHLRKDCPTVKETKESSSIKLQTLNDDNIEDIGQQLKPVTENVSKKPKKIKF